MTGSTMRDRNLVTDELGKLVAFLRRDVLIEISYPLGIVSDWVNLAVQILLFSFVGLMVNPELLPQYGDDPASYVEFVAVGIVVSSLIGVAVRGVVTAVRNEQFMGTLEVLLMTPLVPTTFNLGSVLYDLLYVPIRLVIFLTAVAVAFDAAFAWSGLGPALLVLLAFMPFVWGIGVLSAGATVTFRRGAGLVAFGVTLMTIFSESFIPLDVLPSWARWLAEKNPLTLALDAARQALLGGASYADIAGEALVLAALSVISLLVGVYGFRMALRRERRRGTLGIY